MGLFDDLLEEDNIQTTPKRNGLFDDLLEEDEDIVGQKQVTTNDFFAPRPLKTEQEEKEIGTLEGISNAAKNAFDSSRQAMDVVGGVTPEEAQNIAKIEFDKKARKLAPGYDEYQKAEGMDAVLAFAKNPIEVTSNIVAEGLAGSLPALGAGLVTGGVAAAAAAPTVIGAPVAFTGGQVVGTFAGSLATEYGSKVLEELQGEGMDISDPNSIQKFFSNEELMGKVKDKALTRGVPVAAFDAISAGIGGKLGRVFGTKVLTEGEKIIGKQFATKTGEAATELGVQAGLGGGGEVAGALAVGEPIEGKAVFGEVIGEVGPGSIEVLTGRIADQRAMAKTREEAKIKAASELSTKLEENSAPLTASVVTARSATNIEQDKLAAQLEEELLIQETAAAAAQPPTTDATQKIIQPEGVRQEPQDGTQVQPTPQAGVSGGVFDTARGEEEGQVVPTTQPTISEIPPTSELVGAEPTQPTISEIPTTSELVGAEPTQPTIREVPEISTIVGSEPAAIVEQEPVAPVEQPFTTTTGDAEIDAKITKTETMSPDEYLRQAWETTDGKLGGSYEEWLSSNMLTDADRAKYSQAMMRGDKFPLPYIDKYGGSQDGRNRALAAKEAGIQAIPVGIIEEPSVDVQIQDLRNELSITKSKIGRSRIQERINKLESPAPVEAPAITPATVEEVEFAELNDLMDRRGQAQGKVKGVKFSKKDEARYNELLPKYRSRLLETITPEADPVVWKDIQGNDIKVSQKGTFYTVENGRVRTGPAFQSEGFIEDVSPQPVSAAVVESNNIELPEGYTKQGDVYVYQAPVAETPAVTPTAEVAPAPTEFEFAKEIEAPRENIKKNMIRFASGMSAIGDLKTGTYARGGFKNYGVGFDVGLLSKNAIDSLAASVINLDTQVFIDSGAFSNFKKSLKEQAAGRTVEALDFDKIFEKYDSIVDAINKANPEERADYPRPLMVMPDIIGDQKASLDLIEKYKDRIAVDIGIQTFTPIIPIPLGELSLSQAYNRILEILNSNTRGVEVDPTNFIVGIPSNAKAVSKEDLANFLRESKPPRIHFLGAAADRNITPLIETVAQNSPETAVTADASKVRSAILNGVAKGKTRKQAIFDALYQEDDPEVILNKVYEEASKPEVAPATEPTGISVGNRIKLGKSPQTYIVEEVVPQSEAEKANNEQFYSVKNERTGEVQVVEKADMKQVGGKKARKMAATTKLSDSLDSGEFNAAQALVDEGAMMDRETFIRSITPSATQRATTIHTRLEKDGIISKEEFSNGKGLVYGDGRGAASSYLGGQSYEPFPPTGFTPDYTGDRVAGMGDAIGEKFSTILNTFVLNVVDPQTRSFIVKDIANLLQNGGRAVFVTRGSDVANSKALVSFAPLERIQKSEGKLTYQKGFTQKELIQYLQETLGDGFTVKGLRGGTASDVRVEVIKNTDAELNNPPITQDIRLQAAEFKNEEIVTPIPEASRYTFEEAVKAVDAHFGKQGIPEGIVIVNNTTDPDLEMKAGYFVNRGQIVINLAYIAKGENLGDIIDHELGHYIFGDPEFQADFKQFWELMTPEEKAKADRIISQFYNKETGAIQMEEKQIRAFMQLIQDSKAMPKWKQLIDKIKRWINEKLGTNLQVNDRGALAVLAAAHKRFKSGEQIVREIDSGVLKSAETAQDAEYLAAVERGDMETAQRMVNEAARKEGYAIDSYHGTNGDLFTIFSTEAGGDKTFAESARMGIFSTDNPDVAQTYAENIGAGGAFALGLGQGPLAEARDKAIAMPEFEVFKQAKDIAEKEYIATSKRIFDSYLEKAKTQIQSARDAFKAMLQNKTEAEINQFIQDVAERTASTEFSQDNVVNENPELIAAQNKINEASKAINEYIYPFLLEALPNVRVMQLKLQIKNPKVYDAEGQTPANFSLSDKIQEAKDLGHDGVIFENIIDPQLPATHYVVFKPEQIKSADPVTFDDAGNVIPLSQRFQPSEPDIRRMAAEPRREQVASKDRGDIITTPEGIIKQTNEVLRNKFFDGSEVSDEATLNAWNYIEQMLDIKSGAANDLAGQINDVVDQETNSDTRIGASLFSVSLANYAAKLAAQGDTTMISYLIRRINRMPIDKLAGGISEAAAALRAKREYNIDGYNTLKTEGKSKVERTAAALFGTDRPSEEQVKAVDDAIKASEDTSIGEPEEVAGEIEKVEKRTGRKVVKKIEDKIKESTEPKKEELLISFQNLNADKKIKGIKLTYSPKKVNPSKNIKDFIIGKLADYRKTLVNQGAGGLESTFWQTMSDQERKEGPLAELDKAQNNELAKIVQKTLIDLGLKGEPKSTKMTDIEKVASILNENKLSDEKRIEADQRIVAEIERRREGELAAGYTPEAVNAKYDIILDAWNQSMSRQLNMPVSDNMLQRLISSELKEQKKKISELIDEPDGKVTAETKRNIVDSIIRKIYGVSKEFETGIEMDENYDGLKGYLEQSIDNMYARQIEKKNAAYAKRQAKIALRNNVEGQAQSIIDQLANQLSDTPAFPQKEENQIKAIVQQDLRQKPRMNRKEAWTNQLTGKLIQAGASEAQALTISDLVWRQHEIKAMDRELKELQTAAEKGSLAVIIQRIKDTPLEDQQKPEWMKGVIREYLVEAGLSNQAADTAARLYESVIAERFAEAKQKAFEATLAKSAPWNNYLSRNAQLGKNALKKIQDAIRTGVLDPTQTTEGIIAKENGWSGFSKEQLTRIVQLDGIISDENSNQADKAEAMAELNKIIVKAKMPVRFKDAIGAYYVAQALMGIPTLLVNIVSPIGFSVRNMITDIGRYAFTEPSRIPMAFETFLDSMKSWFNQTSYAFKNQIYMNDVVEYLQGQNVLRELFDKGKAQWAKGDYANGMANMLVGMTQITGRVLSALDQGAISALENQNITRYAMEAMKQNNIPQNKRKEFANMILHFRRQTYMQNVSNGMASDRAGVLADLAVRNEIVSGLSSLGIRDKVLDSAINDALQTVGRNKTLNIDSLTETTKKLSDDGILSYLPISFLENIAEAAGRQGPAMQVFSKMLYGFALVPARVFHTTAWFSPYGFVRLAVDKYKKNKGEDSPYAMSLQTELQYKQRLTETIAGSVVMLGLAALAGSSTDDDEEKKFKIVITGNGPSYSADRQYFDAWHKKYKPYSIHIVMGDTIIPINIGRGGEALFFPIMLAGGLDDWRIKEKLNLAKKEPESLNLAAEVLGSAFFALAQRGPYAAFTKPLFDASKEGKITEELVGQAGFFGKTFIPIVGSSLSRNISDFISDPVDRSSMQGAIYANTPIVGPWLGAKALNALGQPIRADDWGDKLFKLGVPAVFSFPKNTPENELNELILSKGSGPSIPTRSNAQKRFGDVLTDKEFEVYVREYGRVVSDKMFKNRKKLESMPVNKYDDELEKYVRGYSIDGIKITGASDMAVRAVKRLRNE